jgi:hypothetical protein
MASLTTADAIERPFERRQESARGLRAVRNSPMRRPRHSR